MAKHLNSPGYLFPGPLSLNRYIIYIYNHILKFHFVCPEACLAQFHIWLHQNPGTLLKYQNGWDVGIFDPLDPGDPVDSPHTPPAPRSGRRSSSCRMLWAAACHGLKGGFKGKIMEKYGEILYQRTLLAGKFIYTWWIFQLAIFHDTAGYFKLSRTEGPSMSRNCPKVGVVGEPRSGCQGNRLFFAIEDFRSPKKGS